MMKRIALPVLALLFSANAAEIVEQAAKKARTDPAIIKIQADVEKIAQTQFISAVTVPDNLEQSWESFQEALEQEVERRAQIADNKYQNTLARYKKLMQQTHTQHKIRELAWEGSSVEMINSKSSDCDMDCVSMCFSGFNYRFENVESVEQFCLVATCNCYTGEVQYTPESMHDDQWDVTNFGTDRDLYDKNGTQIYTYVGDQLYHRDLDKNGTWLDTWHAETNQTHPYGYRSQENYFDQLNNNFTFQSPQALYDIATECDLECSADCLTLRHTYPMEVVDSCNMNRCGCYFQDVDSNLCNHDCKASCLFTQGGRNEINQCLVDLCQCYDTHVDISIHHDHNTTNTTTNTTSDNTTITHHHQASNETNTHEDVINTSVVADDTVTVNTTNTTEVATFNTTGVISLMGYVGYESYFNNGNTEVVPETDLPLITISVTFAVFMVLVLSVYFILLKKEIQNDKQVSMLGYEDKNIYSEKLNFLENQEVCVSTL